MSVSEFYFSLQGRISRSDFWLKFWLPYLGLGIVAIFADVLTGTYNAEAGVGIVSGAFFLLSFWATIAVSVKRLHDRGKSGWFYLLSFIPLVNIWIAVEILFLSGEKNDNQYGSNPLIESSMSTATAG